MSKRFPLPTFEGFRAPWPMEGAIHDVRVEGDLPAELNGTFYRNGPNPQFAPRGRYSSWYDGDGMVHAFHFQDGQVDYVNRWVRTERFELERQARRALMGTLYEPDRADASATAASPNAANATIVCHGGRVLATWETGLPYEIDPRTLETRGIWDFDGRIPIEMTVHPKIDPATGDMHLFGRTRPHPEVGVTTYHVVTRDGHVVHTTEIEVPYESMTHDMFMTEEYVILPVHPACYSQERLRAGGPYLAWEQERSSYLGILPKGGDGKEIVWIEFEGCFGSHTMNAYQGQDGSIVADTIRYERNLLFSDPDGSWDFEPTPPSLFRWRIDAQRHTVAQQAFDGSWGEMPSFDSRHCGRPYRHGFSAGFTELGPYFDSVHHYDWQTGKRRSYRPGSGRFPHEPVFVPRSAQAAEGDGYLLTLVYDAADNRSDLVILEACDLTTGPIATVQLPHRTGSGLHGVWLPAAHQ